LAFRSAFWNFPINSFHSQNLGFSRPALALALKTELLVYFQHREQGVNEQMIPDPQRQRPLTLSVTSGQIF